MKCNVLERAGSNILDGNRQHKQTTMEFSAAQIAQVLAGQIEGDSEVKVSNISKIEEGTPGTLAFLANPKYEKFIYETQASIVLVNKDFVAAQDIPATLIRVENAYQAFASLLEMVSQARPQKTGVDQTAYIAQSAQIGENVYVGPFAYVGENVKVGDNCKIFPHVYLGDNVVVGEKTTLNSGVKVYHDCQLGKQCIVHAGTVIGGDGFGFAPQADQNYQKIHHIGNVVIEDSVEIGSNVSIDRATMGSTIIRKGVKLDNLIQIAHNVEIGERTVIAAQSGVSGSTKIGKDCMIGGQVGLVGHITIADGVKIAAQSGISSSIKTPDKIVQGAPAFQIKDYLKSYAHFKNLPDLARKIQELENKIKKMTEE